MAPHEAVDPAYDDRVRRSFSRHVATMLATMATLSGRGIVD